MWLQRGEITPSELTHHYLSRIEQLNASLGAFTTVTAERAVARADLVERAGRKPSALWGIPFGDKDLSSRKGARTTFGSRLFLDFIADVSDEIVEVLDDAGGISLGSTSTPEFGLSSYTESFVAPPARTPWNLSLGAGGSSGGAAVAVAAGLLPCAPGSDGGGSIRIPAAATGLVGLKPSRGRVPAGSGLASLAGLVVQGPLARTVGDAAMLLDAMVAGGRYPFSVGAPSWDGGALMNAAVRGEGRFNLGVMTTSPWDDEYDVSLAPEAKSALALAVGELSAIGHGIEEFELEADPTFAPSFRAIWQASAATIPAEGRELELCEPLTRWLIERGRSLSAREVISSLTALTAFERSVIRQFHPFDAVLTPSLAMTPRPLGWYDHENPERNFEQQVQYTPYTSVANVSGLPAVTLPVAMTADGLPMGVQLIGRPGGEHVLLAIGAQLERRFAWQHRHPACW